jgi:hypothetical protein
MALKRLDLPTLARPTIATIGAFLLLIDVIITEVEAIVNHTI